MVFKNKNVNNNDYFVKN